MYYGIFNYDLSNKSCDPLNRMLDAARKDALFAIALNEKDGANNTELHGQLEELLDEISK